MFRVKSSPSVITELPFLVMVYEASFSSEENVKVLVVLFPRESVAVIFIDIFDAFPLGLNIILLLSSCGTIKEGFTNQKKSSTDEFLVEKKLPLKMPPNYEELPIPKYKKLIRLK